LFREEARCAPRASSRLARFAVIFAATMAPGLPWRTETPAEEIAPAACVLEPGEMRTVARIVDGETLVLDDGSEVRLAGVMAPRARDAGAAAGLWPPENEAIAELSKLVLGKQVRLGYGALRTDRFGRKIAHLFLVDDGAVNGAAGVWVEGDLLAAGVARAAALPGAGECLEELLAHESVARKSELGLWALKTYQPIEAGRTALLMTLRSTFQIVRGEVRAVSRARSAIYLNFGADWHSDFSVRVPLDLAKTDPEWEKRIDALKGAQVEVRGWIERGNGPLIALGEKSELAILKAPLSSEKPEISGVSGQDATAVTPQGPLLREPSFSERPPPERKRRPEQKAPDALDL